MEPQAPRPRVYLTQAEFDALPLKQSALQLDGPTKSGWFRDSENPGHVAWYHHLPQPRPPRANDIPWTLYPVKIVEPN